MDLVDELFQDPISPPHSDAKAYLGMVIIGALNNLPYWVAISNAQAIVTHFDKDGFLGAITWGVVFFGMFATSMNAFLSSRNVSYTLRSIANGIFMSVGLIGTAFAPNIYIALVGVAFVGLSSDFGEGVMLGYFASVSNHSLMGAWGVATGISGILGAGYAFLCQFFNISYFISFLVLCPSGLFYPLSFIFLLDHSPESSTSTGDEEEIERDMKISEVPPPGPCACTTWRKTAYYFVNNAIVFFCHYTCISGLTDCAMTAADRVARPYVYGLLSLCFQFGSLLGRSTLKWIKIQCLWILTSIEVVIFLILTLNVRFSFLPLWGKIAINLALGLDAGLSYVNVFDQIMGHEGATVKEREIMANLTSIGIAGNVILASAYTLLMQNTFFQYQCIER
jgi:MFS family permease